jgi:hypothetical protein
MNLPPVDVSLCAAPIQDDDEAVIGGTHAVKTPNGA